MQAALMPAGRLPVLGAALVAPPGYTFPCPFFLQGLQIEEDELLEAMDVCEDAIRRTSTRREAKERAMKDMNRLAGLAEAKLEPRRRYKLLLSLMEGTFVDNIERCSPRSTSLPMTW